MTTPLQIGDTVSYNTHGITDRHRFGRVVAHERYTDDSGAREWYYVRWFCPDGKPDHEPMKHHLAELNPARRATP